MRKWEWALADISFLVDIAFVRASEGSEKLSPEGVLLVSLLLYEPPMRDPKLESPIELAKRLGTYGKIDRSKQYEGRYSAELLLRSDNHQWARLRKLEKERLRNGILLAIISAALAWLPVLAKAVFVKIR